VEIIWRNDQLLAETFTQQHTIFEPTISAGEWQQTYGLDRATTGIGVVC